MMVKKGVVLALIAAALATAVTAAFGSAGGKAKEVDTLTWALTSGPRSLDLAHTMDVNSASALALGMESLLKIDSKGRLVPNLAASYKRVNLTTYVFNLRKNVHFWDGKLMTSADVVWSLNRHVDPKSGSQISTWFAAMKKAVATGPFQVTVHLKHPDPVWIYMPASTAYIIEKAYALAKGKDLGTPSGGMMGTGPYRFTDYKPDESLTLERNDAYWGKKPAIKTIELKFITEDSTRLLALRSGQIDGTFIIPLAASKSWERLHGVTVSYAPGMNQDSFGFDMTMKPFSDIHVRRAFAYSLDRQGLVKSLLQGHGEVAVGQGAPAQWRTLTDPNKARAFYRKIDGFRLDLGKAKAELQKSAYPNGFSATIFFADGFPETGKIAQSLSANLAKIGIKLTVKQEPTDAWVPQIFKHTGLGIIIGQSQPDYPDPWDFPAQYYASWNARANALNWANYKNPAMDKLILAQAKAPTNAERVRLLMQAERMMRRDLAYLPVFYMETGLAISDKYRFSDFDPIYFTRNWAHNITAR